MPDSRFSALVAFLVIGFLTAPASLAAPNIIFILADDLGYGDLGCYGQKRIKTPRLDRMAAEGIRFTQCYAGSTVCAPSRSVLMQGLSTGHCRVRGNAGRQTPLAQSLRSDDRTVAHVLKEAGYATALMGKWGLGDVNGAEPGLPRRQGFDEFFGYLNQHHAHNYYPSFLWRNEDRVLLPNTVPREDPQGGGKSDNKVAYSPDLILHEALDFIRRNKDRPFFLYFAATLPHANNEARQEGMEVPDLGEYSHLPWPAPARGYAAMVTHLDRAIGQLLDLVGELGLDDHTIVFFSSDNGPHREGGNDPEFHDSNAPWRGIKRDLYEGGIRVPMIVRWPGRVPDGRISDAVWWFADFLPTAAALAGVQAPRGLDGLNILPLLLDRRAPNRRKPLYWEFHENGFKQAIRRDRWKGVRLGPEKPLELFDLRTDPAETVDLAAEHPREVRRLTRWLGRLRTDSPDWPVPVGSPAR